MMPTLRIENANFRDLGCLLGAASKRANGRRAAEHPEKFPPPHLSNPKQSQRAQLYHSERAARDF